MKLLQKRDLDLAMCRDFLALLNDYVISRRALTSLKTVSRFFAGDSDFSMKTRRAVVKQLRKNTLNLFHVIDIVNFELLFERERLILLSRPQDLDRIEKISEIVKGQVNYRNRIFSELKERHIHSKSRKERKIIKGIIGRLFEGISRMVVLVTHRCQLRCSYCRVRKFDAEMTYDDIIRSIDLLLSSAKQELQLQFFGGEPLLRFDDIKKATAYAENQAAELGKELRFILTTNGIALSAEKVDFFKEHGFTIELSLDGSAEAQSVQRKSSSPEEHYRLIVGNLKGLFESGVRNYAIMVVTPESVSQMMDNFRSLVGYGFKQIQVNYALGRIWNDEDWGRFEDGMKRIAGHYSGQEERFLNFTERREPVVLNAEATVDCDGTIFLETGICIEEDFSKIKENFKIGELRTTKNANLLATTKFLTFSMLTRAYSENAPEFRKVVLNNIVRGEQLARLLTRIKRDKME